MPDGRTAYLGDDGAHVQMTLFVADQYGDLSAGTLYTAKWNQTSSNSRSLEKFYIINIL